MAVTSRRAVNRGLSLYFSAPFPSWAAAPEGSVSWLPRVLGSQREKTAPTPPYLRRSSRRRSRTPIRGIHTGARSTRPARSRGRCRPRSRTGPGRGTQRPLGASRAPCTGARTRPGTACTWHLARSCMGDKPQQGLGQAQTLLLLLPTHVSSQCPPRCRQNPRRPHIALGARLPLKISQAKGTPQKLSPEK